MIKPLLIVITGRPASGKTTLAGRLSRQVNFPLLSRDKIKEGYMSTTGEQNDNSDSSIDWHVYETFFQAIDLLIAKNVSLIIEAAFQDKLWKPKLSGFLDKADLRIIVCQTSPELARVRFNERLANDASRIMLHGESPITSPHEKTALFIETYESVNMDVPTLHVDTTRDYNPHIDVIVSFIKQKDSW